MSLLGVAVSVICVSAIGGLVTLILILRAVCFCGDQIKRIETLASLKPLFSDPKNMTVWLDHASVIPDCDDPAAGGMVQVTLSVRPARPMSGRLDL